MPLRDARTKAALRRPTVHDRLSVRVTQTKQQVQTLSVKTIKFIANLVRITVAAILNVIWGILKYYSQYKACWIPSPQICISLPVQPTAEVAEQ